MLEASFSIVHKTLAWAILRGNVFITEYIIFLSVIKVIFIYMCSKMFGILSSIMSGSLCQPPLVLLLLLLLLNQLYIPGWVLACSTIFFQASLSPQMSITVI